MRQWIGRFEVYFLPGFVGVKMMPWRQSVSIPQSVLDVMENWTRARGFFAVKECYTNVDSFVIAQREFRREFGIHRNRAVPSAHAIKTWVQNFEATGSTLKTKCGSLKTAPTPENPLNETHAVLHFATLHHSCCPNPGFDGFCTKISTSTPIKL
jgi:hypothetical protein